MTSPHQRLQELIRQGDLLAGRYRIGRRAGAGAYGMIFRAVDETTGEHVAVKAIPPQGNQTNSTALGRFQREMKVIRNLLHPNIISLYDWGQTDGGLIFMILEFIEGDTLDDAVRNNPMDLETAVDVARQLAMALQVAHSTGVIHRDLKPANVMLIATPHGGYKLKVLDFGMAKVLSPLEDESIVDLTREGMAVGTPRYIAPEQARGLKVGPPADLYAAGLLLYEILTGVQAVQANTVEGAVAAHVSREPLELDEIDSVPPVIRPLLFRLLEKDPQRRIQSAGELLAGLDQVTRYQKEGIISEGGGYIGPALGDQTGDFPGARSKDPEVVEVATLATIDPAEFQQKNEKKSLIDRLRKSEDDVELDYDRFEKYAVKEKDPIYRRKREQQGRWLRLPITNGEWAEAIFSILLIPLTFILVGAQAAGLDFGLRVAMGLAAPTVALLIATAKHSAAWDESFGRLCWICCFAGILLAHLLGPTDLATELVRDPTWFLRPIEDMTGMGLVGEFTGWISRHWAGLIFRLTGTGAGTL